MRTTKKLSGQSLIEFALILPLILFLLMGLFDVGRAILYYSILNTAVREGSRFAIVQSYCDYKSDPAACTGGHLDTYPLDCAGAQSLANTNICNAVTDKFFNISSLSNSTITIDHTLSITNDPMIDIDIAFPFEPITPGLSLIGDITIQVNSQMILAPIAIE